LRKASLSQWRSLLAQYEREAFIVQRLLAKIYHPGCRIFPRYIIRHIARQRKKLGVWHLQGGCNYELLLRKASLSQCRSLLPNAKEKPSLYRGSWQKYITQDAEFFPDTSLDT
jgi:hypothetical protein